MLLALAAPLAASAGGGQGGPPAQSYVAPSLTRAAADTPTAQVQVIVQSDAGAADARSALDQYGTADKKLGIADASAGTIQAANIDELAAQPGLVITPDNPVALDALGTSAPAQLSTLSAAIATFGIDKGLAGDLQNRLADAGKRLGKPADACNALDGFSTRVLDEAGKDKPKLAIAQAEQLVQGANAVEQTLGCIASDSVVPGAEQSLLEVARAIGEMNLSGDLGSKVFEAAKRLVGSKPGDACKAITDLEKGVQDATGKPGKLSQAQGAQLSSLLASIPVPSCPGRARPAAGDLWPSAVGVDKLWPRLATATASPAIAFVDSGIEAGRADFGGRVLANVNLTALPGNSPGDGFGHGTLVAGLAAGSSPAHTGAAPAAGIVSLDVMDDNGMARTSDVIRAAQWILANHDRYDIRVANFSLHSTTPTSFRWDPLDKAVEKLWFAGVVVVASAGNDGQMGKQRPVAFAPGNDPFAITVGALDLHNSTDPARADVAPWSDWGYTFDGFAKPEVCAPGRSITGPVPAGSTLANTSSFKSQVQTTPDGTYMTLSGTSLSAPIVSGIAADLLSLDPSLSPDEVKGALMLGALPLPKVHNFAGGVGEAYAPAAAAIQSPPNPNMALDQFLIPDPSGDGLVFDDVSWRDVVTSSPSWDSVSWRDGWLGAAWSLVSWANVSWANVSWANVSWSDVSWSDVSWNDVYADVDLTR